MSRGRILVADDNEDILRLVDVNLRFEDYDTITVTNGEDALAHARADLPDLILLDLMLPHLDGWQVLKALKADPRTRTIPVVLMTGLSLRNRSERLLVEGVADYLSKPFNPLRLLEIVADLVGARQRAALERARPAPAKPPTAASAPTRVLVIHRVSSDGILRDLLGNTAIQVIAVIGAESSDEVALARDLGIPTLPSLESLDEACGFDLAIDTGQAPDRPVLDRAARHTADVLSGRALRFMRSLLSEREQSHLKERDLVRELNRRVGELSILKDMSSLVSSGTRGPDIFSRTLEQALRLSDFVAGAILMYSPQEERFTVTGASGLSDLFPEKARISLSDPIMDELFTLRRPVSIPDVSQRFSSNLLELAAREDLVSLTGLPVLVREKVAGVMLVGTRKPHRFTPEETRLLSTIVGQMAVALENEHLSQGARQKQLIIEQLLAKVIQAQEDERKHLAAELHDGVAQSLAGMLTQLQICQAMLGAGHVEDASEQLGNLRKVVGDNVKEIRQIIFNLRPSSLDDLGLIPSIENYIKRFEREHALRVAFTVSNTGRRLPSTLETTAFRIVQEALTNVKKHAQAEQVWIKLTIDSHHVTLIVADDGQGFSWNDVTHKLVTGEAHGLAGMRERATLLGGSFKVSANEPRGTSIRVEIPIPREPAARDATLPPAVPVLRPPPLPQGMGDLSGALEWLGEPASIDVAAPVPGSWGPRPRPPRATPPAGPDVLDVPTVPT